MINIKLIARIFHNLVTRLTNQANNLIIICIKTNIAYQKMNDNN